MTPAPTIHAVCFDAAGTLLHPAEPVARVYARTARAHGVQLHEDTVAARFFEAFAVDWPRPRMPGDGRPFWRHVVATSTGSTDAALFEALYSHYAEPEAWIVTPGTQAALQQLRAQGLKTALLSNWDTRLGPLLAALGLSPQFDFIGVSGELGVEKPHAGAFHAVADGLDVGIGHLLHVGDSATSDVAGARAAGAHGQLWTDFEAVFTAVDRRNTQSDPSHTPRS